MGAVAAEFFSPSVRKARGTEARCEDGHTLLWLGHTLGRCQGSSIAASALQAEMCVGKKGGGEDKIADCRKRKLGKEFGVRIATWKLWITRPKNMGGPHLPVSGAVEAWPWRI